HRDSIAQYQQAGRNDLVQKESFELKIVQSYLPAPLTEVEIIELIKSALKETGASSMQDMGKVMGLLKPKLQGRADMGKIGALVKAQLQ
ncbi:MAG: GatB/YqeY protein, partial [Gammaproteobacteria bacterium]|nr:GatB/YqeY protein [Gammaproteobacteria bacterium]